jgi:hypothetical protein
VSQSSFTFFDGPENGHGLSKTMGYQKMTMEGSNMNKSSGILTMEKIPQGTIFHVIVEKQVSMRGK